MSPRIMEHEQWLIQDEKILEICLKYVQQSPAHTATEAAQKLHALFPPKRTEEGDMELQKFFLANVWDVILHMIRQIPHEHRAQDSLIEVVEALRNLPTDIIVEIESAEAKVWQDVPFLGQVLGIEYQKIDQQTLPDAGEDAARQEWHSINAFAARLTAEGLYDYRIYGLWALRAALEDQPDPEAPEYQLQGRVLDCHVPVAVTWILRCGLHMYVSDGEIYLERGGKGGRLWQGEEGFDMERWRLWKRRFSEISKDKWGSEKTRQLAQAAEKEMIEVEIEVWMELESRSESESGSEWESESESELESESESESASDFESESEENESEEKEDESEKEVESEVENGPENEPKKVEDKSEDDTDDETSKSGLQA
ncbi:tripartite motif containing 44 [Xylographa pallens]|nr:tripartite motif containing 44 [Xylographa pallens]